MEKMIQERAFDICTEHHLRLSKHFPKSIAGSIACRQVVRSGTSVGSNVEEAQAGDTKDDFTYKMNTALKESRETPYWRGLAKASGLVDSGLLDKIIGESDEIRRMLGAIVSTSRKSQ